MCVGDGSEDGGPSGQDLYQSTDLRNWTKIADDVQDQFGNQISTQGGTNFNWGRKVNGTYYLYQSRQDTSMYLYTGTDLANLTNHGQVLDESDGGGFYDDFGDNDPNTGLWHMYYEAGTVTGPSGDALGHATSVDGFTWVKQPNLALDLGPTGWKTGDPDLIKVNDTYHMFIDNTVQHPNYRIAWATSTDLYNWTLQEHAITSFPGGDATVRYLPDTDEFFMYQEYRGTTGPNENEAGRKGIGYATAPASGFLKYAALDPASLAGLKLWLKDADTDFTPGAGAADAQWLDRSGQDNHLQTLAASASADPTLVSITNTTTGNTFAAVQFADGATELMKSDLLGAEGDDFGAEGTLDDLTIFTVYRIQPTDAESNTRPYGFGANRDVSPDTADHFNLGNDPSVRKDNGFIDNTDEDLPLDEFFIRISRMTGAGNNYDDIDEWLYLDGGQLDLLQTRGGSFTTSDDDFFLGDLRFDATAISGDDFAIAEMLVYDTALSDPQVSGVAEYLADRYFGFPHIAGDADGDGDGDVDSDDLDALALSWQQAGAGWFGGDFNADGIVDALDLDAMRLNWGAHASSPEAFGEALAAVSLVPEPASLAVLALGGLAALGRRRR